MKTGLGGSLSRLNARERVLVVSLTSILTVLLVGGGIWFVRGKLAAKEAKIKKNRATWAKIQKASGPYLAELERQSRLKDQIRANKFGTKPDSPIKALALKSQVRYREGGQTEDTEGDLGKLLNESGKLNKKPIRGGRKRASFPMYYRIEKALNMQSGQVRTDDLWRFLADVEALDDLVFVSQLSIHRWSQNPDYAKIKNLTVSTLRWVEKEEDL